MPRTKKFLGRIGRHVVEEEVTVVTHWSQMVGEDIVRCDDDAREKGWGTWRVEGPAGTSTWSGRAARCGLRPQRLGGQYPDPELWISDYNKATYISEKDYS